MCYLMYICLVYVRHMKSYHFDNMIYNNNNNNNNNDCIYRCL